MPNKPRPENRHRMVRVEDELWTAAKGAARENGTTVSAVVRAALTDYVEQGEAATARERDLSKRIAAATALLDQWDREDAAWRAPDDAPLAMVTELREALAVANAYAVPSLEPCEECGAGLGEPCRDGCSEDQDCRNIPV